MGPRPCHLLIIIEQLCFQMEVSSDLQIDSSVERVGKDLQATCDFLWWKNIPADPAKERPQGWKLRNLSLALSLRGRGGSGSSACLVTLNLLVKSGRAALVLRTGAQSGVSLQLLKMLFWLLRIEAGSLYLWTVGAGIGPCGSPGPVSSSHGREAGPQRWESQAVGRFFFPMNKTLAGRS